MPKDTATASSAPETERHYDYVVSVRFHNSGRCYTFGTDIPDLKIGEKVVVETAQGLELAKCQTPSTGSDIYPVPKTALMPVHRRAGESDITDFRENLDYAKQAMKICAEEIHDLELGMHLLSADYTLDRTKILFVYQADQRVDFRELLKRLGAKLHCRIELRQIGERDKAKMVGGIGVCGMECCCARFKSKMDVISINMAKNQLLALNTEKLSGMCGKLMCCLKFEDANYKELTAGLPKMGAHVEYQGVMYRVTSMNVMTNEARLENSESYEVITIDDLREKTVVRKGITVGRKSPQRGGKQAHVAPGVRNVHEPQAAFSASESEKSRGISAESKDTPHQRDADRKLNPAKTERKQRAAQPKEKPQAQNAGKQNNRRSGNSNRRRDNTRRIAEPANNPNVTVRSFKSSKTRASEAAAEEKK